MAAAPQRVHAFGHDEASLHLGMDDGGIAEGGFVPDGDARNHRLIGRGAFLAAGDEGCAAAFADRRALKAAYGPARAGHLLSGRRVGAIPAVRRTRSTIVLFTRKETSALAVSPAAEGGGTDAR